MNFSENTKAHMPAWPRKLTSVMEIHRKRFSLLNQQYKQRPVVNHHPAPTMYPVILPQPSRPQHRQQARSKQQIETYFPATSPRRRINSVQTKTQPPPFVPNQQYITLANLTKILHVLETHENANDNSDSATDISVSTTTSAKQRVQQHLQETATRWWRPIRSSDSHPVSSIIHTCDTSTAFQQYSDENNRLQKKFPLLVKIKFC